MTSGSRADLEPGAATAAAPGRRRVEVTASGLSADALAGVLVAVVEVVQVGAEGGLLLDPAEIADVVIPQVIVEGTAGLEAIPNMGYPNVTNVELSREDDEIRIIVSRESATDVHADGADHDEPDLDSVLDDLLGEDDHDLHQGPEIVRRRPGRPRTRRGR